MLTKLGSLYETNSGLRQLAKIEQANTEKGKRETWCIPSFCWIKLKIVGGGTFVCFENEFENERGDETVTPGVVFSDEL